MLRPYLEGVGVSAGEHAAYGRTTGGVVRSGYEAIVADHWKDNVDYQVGRFMKAVEQLKEGETLNIDVVGFSRGAVQMIDEFFADGTIPKNDFREAEHFIVEEFDHPDIIADRKHICEAAFNSEIR